MKLVYGKRELNLVRSPMKGNRLPKRSNGTVDVVVGGAPFVAPVTNNRAWSKSPYGWLEYVWVERDGVAYYATLDPTEKASDWKGAELVIADGVAARKDPVRVTTEKAREDARILKFKETWTAKYG